MAQINALNIEIYDGDKCIARQTMQQQKIIIGRILSADFRVADQRVSRIHALLEQMEDGTLRLTDLASTHGTFVNGERIVEKTISIKDKVSLATLSVKISPPSDADRTLAPAPSATAIPAVPPRTTRQASRIASHAASSQSAIRSVSLQAGAAQASIAPAPAAPAPAQDSPSQLHVAVDAKGQAVAVAREPTVIRSLKDTARTRGVLENPGPGDELEVTVYWENTILHVDHYRPANRTITIGETIENTYIIPMPGIPDKFPLVKLNGHSAELSLHASMKGSVRTQGKIFSIDDLMKTGRSVVTLGGQDIAKIRVGTVNFFMMFVPRPPAIPKAAIFDQTPAYWITQFSVAGLAAIFLSLGAIFHQPIEGQVKEFPEKLRKIIVEEYQKKVEREIVKPDPVETPPTKPPEKTAVKGEKAQDAVKPKDAIMTAKTAQKGGNEGEGARERGAEGKRGRPNAKNETGITNRPKVGNNTKVRDGAVKATNDSILGALKNTALGTQLAKVSGSGGGNNSGGAMGNDPLDQALSGVGGGGIRSGRGSGGSGLQGTGPGGGGNAVGVGGLGSKGFGGGASGTGVGSIPGKGEFAVTTETLGVTVVGGLSREEIARVINAHQSEIQFCYQRELQRDPRLFGKINMKWSIGSGGKARGIQAQENTTGSPALANCISDKIKDWTFPSPPEGSDAVVEWPWIFKPQGK